MQQTDTQKYRRSLKAFKYELILSPIYGVFSSLGLYCFFNYMIMAAFHERHNHPYFAPFCVLAGLASLCICIASLAGHVYCRTFKNNENENTPGSIGGVRIAVAIALALNFFLISSYLWEPLHMMVSAWIKAAEAQALQ